MYAQGLIKLHISTHISHSKVTHSKVPKLYVCLEVYFCIDILYIALLHSLCMINNKSCDKVFNNMSVVLLSRRTTI